MPASALIIIGAFGLVMSLAILLAIWGWPALIIGVMVASTTLVICIGAEESRNG